MAVDSFAQFNGSLRGDMTMENINDRFVLFTQPG